MDSSSARTRKPYTSDLTDAPWAIIEPFLPVHTSGRPRTTNSVAMWKWRISLFSAPFSTLQQTVVNGVPFPNTSGSGAPSMGA